MNAVGLFVILSGLFLASHALTVAEILRYDDGVVDHYCSPWEDEPGSEVAMRFSPSSYPVRLTRLHFWIPGHGRFDTLFEA